MKTYRILLHPGHNRVYYEASKRLAQAELALCAGLSSELVNAAGVDYIEFACEDIAEHTAVLSRLSFTFAVFETAGELLRPIALPIYDTLGAGINSVLKYQGKTNEQLTQMMLNIAVTLAVDGGAKGRLRLLDPMAGRGTTLFEGLRQGFDSCGIEIDSRSAQDAYIHMRKYLEARKFKHSVSERRLSGENKSFKAKISSVSIKKSTIDYGDKPLRFEMAEADCALADKIYVKEAFDLLIADLPYGVQHASKIGTKGKISRSPLDLLRDSLPAFHCVLRTGGAAAFSFNVNVSPRAKIIELLENNGFKALCGGYYDELEHRVDQAILRDVIFAVKA